MIKQGPRRAFAPFLWRNFCFGRAHRRWMVIRSKEFHLFYNHLLQNKEAEPRIFVEDILDYACTILPDKNGWQKKKSGFMFLGTMGLRKLAKMKTSRKNETPPLTERYRRF
jgi:hypothetical protein